MLPEIADSLRYLTVAVKEIADELSDPDYARSLKLPAVELMNFVLRQGPVMTIEGMEFAG